MGSTPPIRYGGPTTKTSGLDLKWFVPTKIAPKVKPSHMFMQRLQVYYDQFDTLVMEEMTKAWSGFKKEGTSIETSWAHDKQRKYTLI